MLLHMPRASCSVHIDLIRGINEEFDRDSYKDRVIWDFRANKEGGRVGARHADQWNPYFKGGAPEGNGVGPFAISHRPAILAEAATASCGFTSFLKDQQRT